jgi:hypothetical protein
MKELILKLKEVNSTPQGWIIGFIAGITTPP